MEYILIHIDWTECKPEPEIYRNSVRFSHKNTMVNISKETVLEAFLCLVRSDVTPDNMDSDRIDEIKKYIGGMK